MKFLAGLALVIATLSLGLTLSPRAHAYVRTTSDRSNMPVQWLERCIIVRPDLRGSQDMSLDEVQAALDRSVLNWASRTIDCSYLLLQSAPALRVSEVGIDGRPTVIFRDNDWQRPNKMHRDESIIALTTVFYVDTPGYVGDATILDADIELNGVSYTFTNDVMNARPRDGTQLADLQNTLTHELGHVQGLAHTCWDHIKESPPLDDQGQPIPDCLGNVPENILATTMYPYPLTPNETSKRNLSQDDVNGICQVYPITAAAPACYNEIDGGCEFSRAPISGFSFFIALALLAWLRRRA